MGNIYLLQGMRIYLLYVFLPFALTPSVVDFLHQIAKKTPLDFLEVLVARLVVCQKPTEHCAGTGATVLAASNCPQCS